MLLLLFANLPLVLILFAFNNDNSRYNCLDDGRKFCSYYNNNHNNYNNHNNHNNHNNYNNYNNHNHNHNHKNKNNNNNNNDLLC